MIVIRGGEVLGDDGWTRVDVAIDGEQVSALGDHLGEGDVEIDASGCWVGPGFVDMHTHLREPGQVWKEDIGTGCAAAAAGGFTAVTAMPNTDPPMDSSKILETVLSRGREVGLVEVVASASVTAGRLGAALADLEALYRAGVRVFTDDGDAVSDPDVMLEAMQTLSGMPGTILAQHAEDPSRTTGGHMHEGAISRSLGIGGMPADAESDLVRRDLEMVARTGARYHCQHVSAKMTVELIRDAKSSGLPVSAEVTPHHLLLEDTDLCGLDTDFKMYPPLRTREDRAALVAGLRDGTIDVVATDHAPHLPEEKAVPFDSAPRGVIGLETAASATWQALNDRDHLFSALSSAPARLLGVEDQGRPLGPGRPANLVVFDPAAAWTPTTFVSKSSNSPFKGRALPGVVKATVFRGQVTHQSAVIAR